MFGNPSWLHFGLALRDIRHKEARSQTPFIEEKLRSQLFVKIYLSKLKFVKKHRKLEKGG